MLIVFNFVMYKYMYMLETNIVCSIKQVDQNYCNISCLDVKFDHFGFVIEIVAS